MPSAPPPDSVRIRPAQPDDAADVARLIVVAGGGVYEFLLDGLFGGATAADLLASGIAGTSGTFSHRLCAVAVSGNRVIGAAHAYPVDWSRGADRSGLPADRLDHMAGFDAVQDWGSYFLSAVAVEEAERRRGVGQALVGWVIDRARSGGFDRVSLHVWADNAPARRLYDRLGFAEIGRAAIPPHPRLPRAGGSVLLRRYVA